MKKTSLLFSAIMLAALVSCNNEKPAETTTETTTDTTTTTAVAEAPAPPMDSAAQMKAWQDYMTPGDAHKAMAAMSGKWKSESTMWMDPSKPPTTSTGVTEFKMIMDGRYQQSTHKGNMMGMPFEGMGTMAYDNAKKKFVSTWIDNMGTGLMSMEGDWNEAGKSYELKGKMVDPMTGKDMDCREVTKMIDDKNMTFEMYCNGPDGKEMKTMEIKYTKM